MNLCANCDENEVAKIHLCGYKDWCEECDTSLWSTRDKSSNEVTANEVTAKTAATTTITITTTDPNEELDYCEECYKTVREIFLVDVNLQGLYLVNDNRPKGAKWCTQECLDRSNVKHPIMVNCKECYIVLELEKNIGGFCKICV